MTYTPNRRWRMPAIAVVMALLTGALIQPVSVGAETLVLVQAGDSLSSIAFDHGVTVDALMAVNGLTDPDLVYMGQELEIGRAHV